MGPSAKKLRTVFTMAAAGIAVNACVTTPEPEVVSAAPSAIEARIAEAMQRASSANRVIAEIETAAASPNAPAPAQTIPREVALPDELTRLVSVEWRGPLEPLLASIADEIDYSFSVTGSPPPSPVTISLHRTDEPMWRIVRDAGTLATRQAAVILNPTERRIEVRYG